MGTRFDEISLSYWENNKKREGSSKSYTCKHNGYVYGDEMAYKSIEFVYLENGHETILRGTSGGPKDAYFRLVEKACSKSESTTTRFLNNKAEKFRIYTKQQVDSFTEQQIASTRIKDDSCRIVVNGTEYYVANNLKVCEYFNSAAMSIDAQELDNWFIRIFFDEDDVKSMEDKDETEDLSTTRKEYVLTVNTNPESDDSVENGAKREKKINVDFDNLNRIKKKIGDLGEAIVIDYERKRLIEEGRKDLALRIEHSSIVKGDGIGYDIQSYLADGTELYIEVKTTKQNKVSDFYLSKKEKAVADKMYSEKKHYLIYRIYNLNEKKGTGELAIFDPPFDNEKYVMIAENWRVSKK